MILRLILLIYYAAIFLIILSFPLKACVSQFVDERLRLYCELNSIAGTVADTQRIEKINQSMVRLGFTDLYLKKPNGFYNVGSYFWPIINYEPNVNGGNPPKNLTVGNLTFQSDPDYFRKEALTIGAGAIASFRKIHALGLYSDSKIGKSIQKSVNSDDEIMRTWAQFCLSKKIKGWNFLDVCYSNNLNSQTLVRQFSDYISAGYLHFLSDSKNSNKLIKFVLIRENNAQVLNSLKLSFSKLRLSGKGEEIEGLYKVSKEQRSVYAYGAKFKSEFSIGSNIVNYDIGYLFENQSPLLGVDRKDKTINLKASIPRPLHNYGIPSAAKFC